MEFIKETNGKISQSMAALELNGDLKDYVWIPNKQLLWVIGKIIQYDEEKSSILCYHVNSNEKVSISKGNIHPVDPTHLEDLDNLILMNNLHEAPLLDLLRRRFFVQKIYTYTGNVLVSLNPYQMFQDLYKNPKDFFDVRNLDADVDHQHLNEKEKKLIQIQDHYIKIPHIYQIANEALRNLVKHNHAPFTSPPKNEGDTIEINVNQSIIISGESGAGKTEASKHVMNFLIEANNLMHSNINKQTTLNKTSNGSLKRFDETIKAVLIESGIIIESFGNAKTVRNDNSSRFGKYIKLQYSMGNTLLSAYTETFLLEKSRLVNVGQGERNYHIFYRMIRGLHNYDEALYKKLHLDVGVDNFKILSTGNCTIVSNESEDTQEFAATCKALGTLYFSSTEIEEIWSLLASLLHLGNATTYRDETSVNAEQIMVEVSINTIHWEVLSSLLGLYPLRFKQCLASQQLVVAGRRSINTKILSESEVRNNIFALIKWMYNRLFNWLVKKVNLRYLKFVDEFIRTPEELTGTSPNQVLDKFIGILDIFGFEILDVNSFEQLCINYTNERLQQQFNEHVFINEQKIYKEEGLNWAEITFRDNQHVIDLVGKKPQGLLFILEEHGMLNRKPDDTALITSFNQLYGTQSNGSNSNTTTPSKGLKAAQTFTLQKVITKPTAANAYLKPRFPNGTFIIKHFAGEVTYLIDGFLVKNNDSLQDDVLELLSMSSNGFIRNAFGVGPPDVNGPGYIEETLKDTESSVSTAVAINPSTLNQVDSPPLADHEIGTGFHPIPPPGQPPAERRGSVRRAITASPSSTLLASPPTANSATTLSKKIATLTTVSYNFRNQLDMLMYTLRKTNPHYVKCIKPNSEKKPNLIEAELVMEQLRYSGILEVVRIRREGFPTRMKFREFYNQYYLLIHNKGYPYARQCSDQEARTMSVIIAQNELEPGTFQLGLTQIFLRDGCFKILDKALRKIYNITATKIQSRYKARYYKQWYQRVCNLFCKLQALIRMMIKKKEYKYIRSRIILIQRFFISKRLRWIFIIHYQEVLYQRRLKAMLKIQTNFRGFYGRKLFKRRKLLLQRVTQFIYSHYQSRRVRRWYLQIRNQCIIIQKNIRKFLNRKHFIKIMMNIIICQSIIRKWLAVKLVYRMRKCLIKIQSCIRCVLKQKDYKSIKQKIISIQSLLRMRQSQQKYYQILEKIIFIQSMIRRKVEIIRYNRMYFRIILMQSIMRRYQVYRKKRKLLKAIGCLQSFLQMILVKKYVKKMKHSVVLMQSVMRRYFHYQKYQHYRHAIITIQSIIRVLIAKNQLKLLTQKRFEHRVVMIQSLHRQRIQRKKFQQFLYQIRLIQSIIRKWKQRRNYLKTIKKIIYLQSVGRGYRCRLFKLKQLHSIQMIQKRCKLFLKRLFEIKYQKYIASVVRIQSFYKKILQKRKYLQVRNHIQNIQTVVRMYLQYKKFNQFKNSVIQIQSKLRMKRQLRVIKQWNRSATTIQSLIRGYLIFKEYQRQYMSIIILQSFSRMIYCRRKYNKNYLSIILIQSLIRKFLVEFHFARSILAAIKIQSFYRGAILRLEYQIIKYNIIKLQSFGRMIFYRRHFNKKYLSIVLIQSLIRRHLVKLHYKKIILKIIQIQKWIRGFVIRMKYTPAKLTHALIRIQSNIRRFIKKLHYKNQRNKIIIVQSLVRKKKQHKIFFSTMHQILKIQSIFRMKLKYNHYNKIRMNIILLQSILRMYKGKWIRWNQIKKIVFIQSWYRMMVVKHNYHQIQRKVIQIQSFIRTGIAYKHYMMQLFSIILIQSVMRSKIGVMHYHKQRKYIIKIQSFIRMGIKMKWYLNVLKKVIRIQSLVRKNQIEKMYKTIYQHVILMQSIIRMAKQRGKYHKIYRLAIRIQKWIRMCQKTFWYKKILKDIIRIQSLGRRQIQRTNYKKSMHQIILVQSLFRKRSPQKYFMQQKKKITLLATLFRGKKAKRSYHLVRQGIIRIQVAIRRFLLNHHLYQVVRTVHMYSSSRAVGSIEELILQYLMKDSWLLHIRNKWSHYCTLLHSLLREGHVDYLINQSISYKDILDVDIRGQNSAHYLGCQSPSLLSAQHLAMELNKYTYKRSQEMKMAVIDEDDDEEVVAIPASISKSDSKDDRIENKKIVLREALSKSLRDNILKEGWLKKKRGGTLMYYRRWFVLTEDHLAYYVNPKSINNPKFALPLEGCIVQRIAGREPTLEIYSDKLSERRNMFGTAIRKVILLSAESEKELQEWLMPLRAVTGISSLRSSNITYVNTEVRMMWLSAVDKLGNTPLHTMMYNADLHRSRTNNLSPKNGNFNHANSFSQNKSNYDVIAEAVRVICWMIDNGSNVNVQNAEGKIPLHLAIEHRCHVDIIYSLIMKGSDFTTLVAKDGLTVTQLLRSLRTSTVTDSSDAIGLKTTESNVVHNPTNLSLDLDQLDSIHDVPIYDKDMEDYLNVIDDAIEKSITGFSNETESFSVNFSKKISNHGFVETSLTPPMQVKLKGYSYLDLFFKNILVVDNVNKRANIVLNDPCLVISVYNTKKQLIEKSVEIRYPLLKYNSVENSETASFLSRTLSNHHSTSGKLSSVSKDTNYETNARPLYRNHSQDIKSEHDVTSLKSVSNSSHLDEKGLPNKSLPLMPTHFMGYTWRMNTPLENLEPGTFVLIELKDFIPSSSSSRKLTVDLSNRFSLKKSQQLPSSPSNRNLSPVNSPRKMNSFSSPVSGNLVNISWGVVMIDKEVIDTGRLQIQQVKYPITAFSGLMADSTVGSSSSSHGVSSSSGSSKTHRQLFIGNENENYLTSIEVDSTLSRSYRPVSWKEIMLSSNNDNN